MMVIKMAKPLGRPILQPIRHMGYNSEEMSKPKAMGTKKFFAIITMKMAKMIKSMK